MSDYDVSIHQNPDALAWTNFFRQTFPDCNVPDDVMLGWFANAMMAMHDHMQSPNKTTPPSGQHSGATALNER